MLWFVLFCFAVFAFCFGLLVLRAVKVKDTDTPEKLQKRVMEEAEWKILPASLELVCKNILKGDK